MTIPKTYGNALKAFKREDYAQAMDILSYLIITSQPASEYYYFRAKIYYFWTSLDFALEDISKAITLNKMDHYSYSLRGRIYCAKGDFEKARENFRYAKFISKEEKNNYYLGVMYFKEGDFQNAEKCLAYATKHFQGDPKEASVLLGYARLQLKDYVKAYSAFVQAEMYNQNRAVVIAGIAKSLLEMSKKDASSKDLLQARNAAIDNIQYALYHADKALENDKNNIELLRLKEDCQSHFEQLINKAC